MTISTGAANIRSKFSVYSTYLQQLIVYPVIANARVSDETNCMHFMAIYANETLSSRSIFLPVEIYVSTNQRRNMSGQTCWTCSDSGLDALEV